VGLTQSQLAIVAKARSLGGGQQGVALTDEACAYLVAVIARDLELLAQFPEIKEEPPDSASADGRSGWSKRASPVWKSTAESLDALPTLAQVALRHRQPRRP